MGKSGSVKAYGRSVFRVVHGVFEMFFHWLFGLVYGGKQKTMPPISDLLLLESATSLAHKIRTKKVILFLLLAI